MAGWAARDIPDQAGRTVLVTGATSGLGLATAAALAARGARVLLGVRDAAKGAAALERVPGGEVVELDLADLASVHEAAADVRERTGDALHVLVNNAGVMGTPPRVTVDGFELQIGTNHLGHAALTWLLMPALAGAGAAGTPARVVTVSSLAHRSGVIEPDDLHFRRRAYRPMTAYSQSKLANLVFARELADRLAAADLPVTSAAAHPGVTDTDLFGASMRMRSPMLVGVARAVNRVATQPVRLGVLPQLYAATAPDAPAGGYTGPRGPGEMVGRPGPARVGRAALRPGVAGALWTATAAETGVAPWEGVGGGGAAGAGPTRA